MAFIYKITNIINNKFYIGYTDYSLERRFNEHQRAALYNCDNMIMHKAIRKYGIENFNIKELCYHPDSYYCLNILEPKYIKKLKPEYNSTSGGEGIINFHHSQKTKDKIRKLNKNRKVSNETRMKMSISHKGKENSEIHIINVKKAHGIPVKIDGIKFVSHNDAALYATQKYHMGRNTALRKIKKGIKDFSIFKNKYHIEHPYTAKKLEKWHTYK